MRRARRRRSARRKKKSAGAGIRDGKYVRQERFLADASRLDFPVLVPRSLPAPATCSTPLSHSMVRECKKAR